MVRASGRFSPDHDAAEAFRRRHAPCCMTWPAAAGRLARPGTRWRTCPVAAPVPAAPGNRPLREAAAALGLRRAARQPRDERGAEQATAAGRAHRARPRGHAIDPSQIHHLRLLSMLFVHMTLLARPHAELPDIARAGLWEPCPAVASVVGRLPFLIRVTPTSGEHHGRACREAGNGKGDRRRPAHRHRAPPAARRAEVGVRLAATGTTCGIPNLAPSVEIDEARPGSANARAVGRVHHASTGPRWRSPTRAARIELARGALAARRLLGGLLLRGRGALPSLGAARLAARKGRAGSHSARSR